MSEFEKSLLARAKVLMESQDAIAKELMDVQALHQLIIRELEMVRNLLSAFYEDTPTIPEINFKEDDITGKMRQDLKSRSDKAKAGFHNRKFENYIAALRYDFEERVAEIIDAIGEPIHISVIENKLREQKILIPGKGTRANIISRLNRANTLFKRTSPGTYGLLEWSNFSAAEQKPRKGKKEV